MDPASKKTEIPAASVTTRAAAKSASTGTPTADSSSNLPTGVLATDNSATAKPISSNTSTRGPVTAHSAAVKPKASSSTTSSTSVPGSSVGEGTALSVSVRGITTAVTNMSTMFSFEPFDPTNCKFQRWLERLQIAFKIHRVSEEDKRDYLLHYMGGATYDVLCNKLKNAEPQTKTFQEIVSILQEHFNPNPLEILENFKFANRKQAENETLSTYLMELEKLAQTCNFGDYLDKALRNQFVFGLQNRAIQSRLLEVRDLTLAKAKDIAFSMEMSNRGADEIHGAGAAYPVQHISITSKKKSKPTTVQRKTACYRCGNEEHFADKCRHRNAICNYCKKMGHLDKVCRTKLQRAGVHTLEYEPDLPACDDDVVDVLNLRAVQNLAGQ
ncbi:uncharacterized protein LOC133392798 [Anopheles gambiae]|uniref:uncharacterized protein LOC133392798 n=1 Tax=Anopheles gambiae TaxID=7165 RepID=UPI002AC8AEE6|nr:uncharacterized protein LOC133392798 [Anopheles gambiae]